MDSSLGVQGLCIFEGLVSSAVPYGVLSVDGHRSQTRDSLAYVRTPLGSLGYIKDEAGMLSVRVTAWLVAFVATGLFGWAVL
jgi:hypothetical protein